MADDAVPAIPLVAQIRNDYKEGLNQSNITVRTTIVKDLVDKEVRRRAEATQKVFDLREATQNELRKIKPTHVGVSLDNKPVGEPIYTLDQAKQHRELSEKLHKYDSALEKALDENDFTKVFELSGGK